MKLFALIALIFVCTSPVLFGGTSMAATASNYVNGTNSTNADNSMGSAMMHRDHARRVMNRKMRRYMRQQRRMQRM